MSDPINPFLDDEDEATPQAESASVPTFRIQRPQEPAAVRSEPATADKPAAPQWGQKGYRKGIPNPHKGTPRSRVTDATAPLLAHVAKFPASTAEAVSLVSVTQPVKSLGYEGGKLRTVAGTMKQLKKFEAMGLVQSYTSTGPNSVTHWGITDEGIVAAQSFGYLEAPNEATPSSLSGMALSHLNHFRFIGLVAAQYACPTGAFKKLTGIDPVSLDQLVSEPQIRRDFHHTGEQLKEFKKEGKPSDWGIVRKRKVEEAIASMDSGALDMSDMFTANPTLRVTGLPASQFANGKIKTQHVPDLVVHPYAPMSGVLFEAWMVEIELSRKHWEDYASLFRVYASAVGDGTFTKIVYHTPRKDIATFMKKIDASIGTNLIATNSLVIKPLIHRDGTPVKLKTKVGD